MRREADAPGAPLVAAIGLEWPQLDIEERRLAASGVAVARCVAAELAQRATSIVGILSDGARIDADLLEQLPRLLVIAECGIGVDGVDLVAAQHHGVTVTNVPTVGVEEVADHTLLLGLAAARSLPQAVRSVQDGRWQPMPPWPVRTLAECTWGVVGYGRIGQAVARRLAGFGGTVLVADPILDPADHPQLVSLDELLRAADVVSLHVPLTESTRGLLGERELSLMRPGAILVNVARGALVDEPALLAALDAGRLQCAALDVLASEPPPSGDPLAGHERTIVTPHMGWFSSAGVDEIRRTAVESVAAVLEGRTPEHVVAAPAIPQTFDPSSLAPSQQHEAEETTS